MTTEPDAAIEPDTDAGPGSAGRGPSRTRPTWTRQALLGTVLVVLCGTIIWFVTRDDRPRAEAGQQFDLPSRTVVTGRTTSVAIPWGRLSVTVGAPVRELPSTDLEPADARAPRGGSFVGLLVDIDVKNLIPMSRTADGDVLIPEIVLLADGDRYLVDGLVQAGKARGILMPGERSTYLAVEGTPKQLRLEVGYDGQRRIVDLDGGPGEPGRFAALDRIRIDYPERDCGPVAWPARFENTRPEEVRCRITWAHRMPYVAGLGWAPVGKAWLVVTQEVRRQPRRLAWRSPSGQRAEYVVDTDDSRTRFALDGTPAAAAIDLNSLPAGPMAIKDQDEPQQAIFPVDAAGGPLTVTIIRELHTRGAVERVRGAPDQPVVPVTWQVRVP